LENYANKSQVLPFFTTLSFMRIAKKLTTLNTLGFMRAQQMGRLRFTPFTDVTNSLLLRPINKRQSDEAYMLGSASRIIEQNYQPSAASTPCPDDINRCP
jgi:hypothetical protein